MARLIACSSCGRVHSNKHKCQIKIRRIKARVDEGVYKDNRWIKVRGNVLEECNYICLFTFYKEGKIVKAECVHHIVEILDDESLAYDEDNLIPMTFEAHQLIHKLYKKDKKKVQEELRKLKQRWSDGDRAIGIPPNT